MAAMTVIAVMAAFAVMAVFAVMVVLVVLTNGHIYCIGCNGGGGKLC